MNRKNYSLLVACGLAVSCFTAPVLAQVAPPPTQPAPEQPKYTPPPKPKPVASPQPTQPKAQESFSARKRSNKPEDLPINVPYPKLAQPGPDGRILRLRQLPDILALRSNPNVGPKSVEQIMPVIYARRNRMEITVIDNLDLYWALTDGMIENLNMADINEMGRAADMIKPLVPEVTLSQELLNRNILSRVQGGMNQYIVREYKKAVTDEIQVLEGEKGLEEVMRFVLDDSIQEARLAYEGMLAEAIGQISELVSKAGLTSTGATKLKSMQTELSSNPGDQYEQLQAFDEAFRELPYEDAMAIFTAMRNGRKHINLAPTIKEINVMHDRKKVMQGEAFQPKVVDPKTGKVLHDGTKPKNETPDG